MNIYLLGLGNKHLWDEEISDCITGITCLMILQLATYINAKRRKGFQCTGAHGLKILCRSWLDDSTSTIDKIEKLAVRNTGNIDRSTTK